MVDTDKRARNMQARWESWPAMLVPVAGRVQGVSKKMTGVLRLSSRRARPNVRGMTTDHSISLVLVGDELLSGRRRDKHLPHFAAVFAARGLNLRQVWIVGDARADVVRVLRDARALGSFFICCGGIGATPDDQTRQAAAEAFERPLEIHPDGKTLLESLYGDRCYPHRIRMVEFPGGAELIPNPVNQVPGFALDAGYFLPGFPEMAWPMAEWVLERRFGEVDASAALVTFRLGFRQVPESDLIPLLDDIGAAHPRVRLSCLPSMRDGFPVEVGATGRAPDAQAAIEAFEAGARAAGLQPHALAVATEREAG